MPNESKQQKNLGVDLMKRSFDKKYELPENFVECKNIIDDEIKSEFSSNIQIRNLFFLNRSIYRFINKTKEEDVKNVVQHCEEK